MHLDGKQLPRGIRVRSVRLSLLCLAVRRAVSARNPAIPNRRARVIQIDQWAGVGLVRSFRPSESLRTVVLRLRARL